MPWQINVYQINVNAGDSAIIDAVNSDTSQRSTVLVDAGIRSAGISRVLTVLTELRITQLNAIVVTHYDNDHLGGFNVLLDNDIFQSMLNPTNPTRVYDTGKFENDSTSASRGGPFSPNTAYTKFQKILADSALAGKIKVLTPDNTLAEIQGTELFWSDATSAMASGSTIAVLRNSSPSADGRPALFCIACNKNTLNGAVTPPSSDPTTDINQRSIAVVLVSEGNQIIHYLGGDLGMSVESELLPWLVTNLENPPLNAMKLSHHGSRYSTPSTTSGSTGDFLSQLKPKKIVLSTGRNKHGHPSLDIIADIADRLGLAGTTTLFSTNYPSYMENQDTFSTYLSCNFSASAQTSLLSKLTQNGLVYKTINSIIDNPGSNITYANSIWGSCQAMPLTYNESVSAAVTKNCLPVGSRYVLVSHSNSMAATAVSVATIANDAGVTNSKKRKAPPSLLFTAMDLTVVTEPYYLWPSTHTSTGDARGIRLAANSDLDNFVQQLTPPYLIFNENPIVSGSTWAINNGVIDTTQGLSFWLNQCGIQNLTANISGSINSSGFLTCDIANISFTAVLDLSQPATLSGMLQTNNTLLFVLTEPTTITLAESTAFSGFLDDNDSALMSMLTKWLPSLNFSVDQQKTQFTFTPSNNNQINLTLVSNHFANTLNLNSDFAINGIALVFSQEVVPALDNTPTGQSSGGLIATLAIHDININVNISLSPVGIGVLSFTPSGDVTTLITNLLSALVPSSSSIISQPLQELGFDINTTSAITLYFSLYPFAINSVVFQNNFTFKQLILETQIMLPQYFLSASLASAPQTLTSTEQLTAEVSVAQNDDDSSSSSGSEMSSGSLLDPPSFGSEIGPASSFTTFAAATDSNTNNTAFTLPSNFPDFELLDFYFTADLTNNSYQCGGSLMSATDGSLWTVGQLSLEELSFSLGKSPSVVTVSVEAFLAIGSQSAIITGTYENSDWTFGAQISSLNLSDIVTFVDPTMTLPIQDLVLTNITSTIDVTNKTFAISAKTTFGNLTFVVNDEKTLFSLALPLVNSKVSAPVVGNLPSMIDSLQLLYVSQAIQDDADPIIILFQQSQALLFPIHGLTAGLQLLVQFDSALGQGNTPASLPVWQPTSTPEPSEYATTFLAVSATPSNTQHSTLWISINQTFGPLSLARLGISVSQGDFCLLFDASVQLGGLTLELQGLGLGFSLSDLTALPSISLSGLGLDYSTPTLSIEGDFLANPSQGGNAYQGSALLSMENFMAAAIGAYTQTSTGSPSIFVYSCIDVPLGGPPFFYVMGFSGGFGYNMNLRIPTQNEVLNFPLVAGATHSNSVDLPSDMAAMMTTLTTGDNPWLTTQAGAEWFAIGINFSTFELIYTEALIIAEFGSNPLFSLIGLSSMQLPKATDYPVAYAEMEMEAVYNMNLGVLCMTALLSPNSYVLTPDCHLTGGFAFYTWFKNQVSGALAGDFVVTLGGYHPAFVPPAWYPNVPRLGFNWQVSDQVTISGDAYFALTPSSAMMGGALNASFNAGNLRAWFNAYADFLINWHPFYYTASIGVSVGASYTLNLWFFTTTLSVEIGATLNLAGPPTHGNVYVDWYIISFSIPFGQQITTTPSVTWTDFCQLLPSNPASTTSSSVNLNRIVVSSGLLQQDANNSVWTVRPHGFSFYTLSAIPATSITFNGAPVTDSEGKTSPDNEVNIKPMNLSSITHTHGITVNTPPGTTWTYTINETNVPDALWGVPGEPSTLAVKLLSNAWTGVTVSAPLPSVGATPGPIATSVFGDISVNNAPLPLNVNSTQSIPQESANSRQTMVSTIATSQTNAARNQVASSLSALGLFNTVSLDSMTQMAQNINKGQCFTESPLQRTFPSTVSRASL